MANSLADQELLAAAARGDQAAFSQLYQRYRNRVYGFAYRMLGTQEVAEDVTHEAFLLLIRRPERYQAERGSLLTFLCAVARNHIYQHLRHQERYAPEPVETSDEYEISTGEPIKRRNPDKLKAEARALTLKDIILSVEGYEVRRNGEKLKGGGGGGASGRYIWLGIPQVGRAVFTLSTPPEGSGFEQTAIVNNNPLIFSIDGAQYEWLSKSRIVTADGSFHVWMKFDPTFSFPSPKAPPKILEQINDGARWSVGAFDTLPGEKKED